MKLKIPMLFLVVIPIMQYIVCSSLIYNVLASTATITTTMDFKIQNLFGSSYMNFIIGILIAVLIFVIYYFRDVLKPKKREGYARIENENELSKLLEPIEPVKARQPASSNTVLSKAAESDEIGKMDNVNFNKLNETFKTLDDEYYDKAQKVTNLEITHAHIVHNKQLDLEIVEAARKRLTQGFI